MKNSVFIRINKTVTADQAALVAAGIDPVDVDGRVSEAKRGNWTGWETAAVVRDALFNNLANSHFDPEPSSISYVENYGYNSEEIIFRGLVDIIPALLERGAPHHISFEAGSLWLWVAKNVGIDPELNDYITGIYAKPETTDRAKQAMMEDEEQCGQLNELESQLAQVSQELATVKSELQEVKQDSVLHNTELLKLVSVVQRRYWGANWDPSNKQTNTAIPVIVEWLTSTYSLSDVKAKAVEAVACPIDRNPVKKP